MPPTCATPSSSRAGRSRRERAQDRLRLEGAPEPGPGHPRGEGPAGHPLQAGLPRPLGYALSLTNTDPRKTDLFPKFRGADRQPGLRFPVTREVEADVSAEERALDQVRGHSRTTRTTSRPSSSSPSRRGGDVTSARVPPGPAGQGAGARGILRPRRGPDGVASRAGCGPRALRPRAGRGGLRQEDAGLRLHVGPRVDEEPENVFKVSRASAPPGAAGSRTWSAPAATSR